jgi:hypothetical protein|uniref:Zinc finger MYM-type protein 1 n=1 Tax=Sipha flava TaxID=143950 RepID=A0A2S2Q6Y0_9HEMI
MQSEISRSLVTKNLRIYLQLHSSSNRQITENREVVRSVIEVLLFIARQNIAIRDHDEKICSQNRGNFLELLILLAHNNPSLMVHFDKINSKEKKIDEHSYHMTLKI